MELISLLTRYTLLVSPIGVKSDAAQIGTRLPRRGDAVQSISSLILVDVPPTSVEVQVPSTGTVEVVATLPAV